MIHMIYDGPAYQLAARVSRDRRTGRTLELFATYPLAQHPRSQRIACLTLPDEAFASLAAVCLYDKGGDA